MNVNTENETEITINGITYEMRGENFVPKEFKWDAESARSIKRFKRGSVRYGVVKCHGGKRLVLLLSGTPEMPTLATSAYFDMVTPVSLERFAKWLNSYDVPEDCGWTE